MGGDASVSIFCTNYWKPQRFNHARRIRARDAATAAMNPSGSTGGRVLALRNLGMCRSCLECGRRKKKCDGRTPCSRCRETGVRCTYSKRKWHQPGPVHQQQHHPRGTAAMQSTDASSGELLACGMLHVPLKRFRLSASPATGLVGMHENAFLSDFFGCVGFLPLTTQSHVRGAMVRMMTGATAQQQLGALDDSPDQGQLGAIFTEDGITTGSQLSTGPSACTFWGAVGVGALVKGTPVASVTNYSRLARGALDAYTGPVDVEVAEASAILGYLLGFMGEMAKYEEYMKLSASFLATAIQQGSNDMLPSGFAEMIDQTMNVQVYSGDLEAPDMHSLAARRQRPPQINPAACEGDMYRYVAQSINAFMQLALERACEDNVTIRPSSDDEPCKEDRDDIMPHGNAPQAEEVSGAMVAGLRDNLIAFEHLQEAADRTLAFQKAANGDAGGALERFGYCVEVFELYPGLCRCMLNWGHMPHGVLAALAAIDNSRARALYGRLRDVYNPSHSSTCLPAPHWEEWRGMSAFCDTFQCSLYAGMITTIAGQGLSVFSNLPHYTSDCTGSRRTHCADDHLQPVGGSLRAPAPIALEVQTNNQQARGLVTDGIAEDGAQWNTGDEKENRSSDNDQAEDFLPSHDTLTMHIREAVAMGNWREVQTLMAGASETDRNAVLRAPYGGARSGLHDGTTPLLHAARCKGPETFEELLRTSPPQQIVEMLTATDRLGNTILTAAVSSKSVGTFEAVFNAAKRYLHRGQFAKMLSAKDQLGHTILTAAVSSHSEETCKTVFNVAKEYLNQEQLWLLIESQGTDGETLLSAAVRSGSVNMFEATLDYALEYLGHHELCVLLERVIKDGRTLLFSAPYAFSRALWSKSLEPGHFGFFESVTRVVPSVHRYQLVGTTSPFLRRALQDHGLLRVLDARYMDGHKVADEPCSRLDALFEACVEDLLNAHPEDVDSGFKTLSFLMAGSARPSASDLKKLSKHHKSRDGFKNCCLRAVTSAANPFMPGLLLSIRLAEAAKEANEGEQRHIDEIRASVEALLLEIFERLPRTVRAFDEETNGGCTGMFEPQFLGGHQPLGFERPINMILSKQEQMNTFCNVPLVMDFLSRRFAWGLPDLQDTEGVLRNSEDLKCLGAGLVLGDGGDDVPRGCKNILARLSVLLQAAQDDLPNLAFFPGAQFVVAGVAADPSTYYRVPAMRMLLDFVAYVAMIAALGYLVFFHSPTGGVLGEDGISDVEFTWGEGSFATIFISAGVYREGLEMSMGIDKYFKDQWNVLDALALLCLSVGLVIRGVDWTSPWGPAFYALSAPLLVCRVLFFAQVLPFQGPMIKVIPRMTTTLLKFGFVMVVVMTGFAMAFHVLFRDFDSFGMTFLGLFRAMLGEVDFFETFAGGRYDSVATILFVVYLFVVTVKLLNLLVAILSTSHAEVQDNVKVEVKVSKARVVEHYQWVVDHHELPAPFNLLQLVLSVAVSSVVMLRWLVLVMPERIDTLEEGWEQTKASCVRVRKAFGQFVFWLVLGLVAVSAGAVLWMVSGLPLFPYSQFAWYKQYKAEELKQQHNALWVGLRWWSICWRCFQILVWCVVGAPVSLFVLWLAAFFVQVLSSCRHIPDEEYPSTVERLAIERMLLKGDAGKNADKLRQFLEDPMDDEYVRQDEKDRRATVEHIKLLRNRLEKTTKIELQHLNERLDVELQDLNERLNDRMASLERLVKDVLEHQTAAS